MNLFSYCRILKVYVAVVGCIGLGSFVPANAQAGLPFKPPTPPSPDQAVPILRVTQACQVLEVPLTLSIENVSLAALAARVQKSLVEAHSTPKMEIQVRNARPVRLSFAVKKSTVGEVLNSSGMLAGVELWVFSDHLLLAPFEALLPDEKVALEKGAVVGMRPSNNYMLRQGAFASFVANEIQGLKDKAGASGAGTPGGSITFNQLSPESQAMLQLLVAGQTGGTITTGGPNGKTTITVPRFDLASNPTVTANPTGVEVHFPQGQLGWSAFGSTVGVITSHRSRTGPSQPSMPPLDPSAGNS